MSLIKFTGIALGTLTLFAIVTLSTAVLLSPNKPKDVVKELLSTDLVKADIIKDVQVLNPPILKDKSLEKTKYKLSGLDLNNRVVYIYGEINEASAPLVAEQILKFSESSEPMYIFIDSPGGSVISGAAIISAMEAAKGPVNTVCIQLCASMAAMIHQYGTNRLMLNRAFLMFHPASGGVEGEVDKAFSRLSTMRRFIGKMEENVASRSKISYEEYKRKSGVELWIDSEDAYNDSEKLFNNSVATPPSDRGRVSSNPTLDIYWE